MPKAISTPLEKTFKLDQFDPTGETFVIVRQATQAQHERRAELFDEITRIYNDAVAGETQIKQRISVEELKRIEVMLTLAECNILDEDGATPLFTFVQERGRPRLAMTENRFKEAWGKLPTEVAEEIHKKIREVNPTWGPSPD